MIKTTWRPEVLFRAFSVPVFLGLFLGVGGGPIKANETPRAARFALSVSAGTFRAEQASFRKLYGNAVFPVSMQLRARLVGGLSVAAGYRFMKVDGTTAIVGPAADVESYALAFKMSSFRAGLRYDLAFGRFGVFAGAGGSYNRYDETWQDVPGFGGSGNKPGWYADLGGEFFFNRFLSLFLCGDYSFVPTGKGAALEEKVNLGGMEASAGLAFRFRP